MPPADARAAADNRPGAILALAWPIVLANIATPLLALTDTAIIGRVGSTADLGGLALGGLMFNLLYWAFGFLRMGTTGFVARADGAGDSVAVRAHLLRALLLAGLCGAGLLLCQWPLLVGGLALFEASGAVESVAAEYLRIRLWSAPASLAIVAMMGCLIGLGASRTVLAVQLVLNGLNITLDLLLGVGFGLGIVGVAIGTVIAEWLAAGLALLLVHRALRARQTDTGPMWPLERLRNRQGWRELLAANGDIMLRTLCLLFGFAWFTNQGAQFGDTVLAANHLLLQFVTFSAYFLDGFANAAESRVGQAIGARRIDWLDAVVRTSCWLAAATAAVLAGTVLLLGPLFIGVLTDLEAVRRTAEAFLPWTSVYILLSVGAFQLDGIFIGASRTRAMRNASLAALLVFLGVSHSLSAWQNLGLWAAFVVYVAARAGTLLVAYPALRRMAQVPAAPAQAA